MEKKILVFENTILRRIVGPVYDNEINRWRRRHNIELREITQVPLITDVMKRHRLKWAGHVARMPPERYPKIILEGNVGGRRFRGRPRKRWRDYVQEDVDGINDGELGDGSWMEVAQDRQRWRGLVRAVMGHQARQPVE